MAPRSLFISLSLSRSLTKVCACMLVGKEGGRQLIVHTKEPIYVLRLHPAPCLSHPMRVLQCVAVCCSVLQCVAVCCSVLQGLSHPMPCLNH